MQKLGDDAAGGDQKQVNPQESRKLAIQRCILSLEHACQCRDENCHLHYCQKMKRIALHSKTCKQKGNGSCAICKQLIALSCHHAKNCQKTECPVPFCSVIKSKLMERRIATSQNHGIRPGSSNQPSLDSKGMKRSKDYLQYSKKQKLGNNVVVTRQSVLHIPQVMLNPGTSAGTPMQQSSTAQVLQQLLTSLKSSNFPQQKQQVLHILKSNPQLMAAFIKQRQQQQQQQQQVMVEQTLPQPEDEVCLMMEAVNMSHQAGPAPGDISLSEDMSNPGT